MAAVARAALHGRLLSVDAFHSAVAVCCASIGRLCQQVPPQQDWSGGGSRVSPFAASSRAQLAAAAAAALRDEVDTWAFGTCVALQLEDPEQQHVLAGGRARMRRQLREHEQALAEAQAAAAVEAAAAVQAQQGPAGSAVVTEHVMVEVIATPTRQCGNGNDAGLLGMEDGDEGKGEGRAARQLCTVRLSFLPSERVVHPTVSAEGRATPVGEVTNAAAAAAAEEQAVSAAAETARSILPIATCDGFTGPAEVGAAVANALVAPLTVRNGVLPLPCCSFFHGCNGWLCFASWASSTLHLKLRTTQCAYRRLCASSCCVRSVGRKHGQPAARWHAWSQ